MAANYTLTGTFQQLTGVSDPTGKLVIALANFGNLIPKAGAIVISAAPITITCSGGTFSQLLYGNDQITPSGTFYTIALFDSTGRFISEAAYQLSNGGTNDLSAVTPLQSNPPTPVTAYAPIASPAFTGVPSAPTPLTADNSTTLATTAYVKAQAGGAPAPTSPAGFLLEVGRDWSAADIGTNQNLPQGGTINCTLMYFPHPVVINQFAIPNATTAAVAAAYFYFGIYNNDSTKTLIAQTGAVLIPKTPLSNILQAFTVTLPAGTYWFAWASSDITGQSTVTTVPQVSLAQDLRNDYVGPGLFHTPADTPSKGTPLSVQVNISTPSAGTMPSTLGTIIKADTVTPIMMFSA